ATKTPIAIKARSAFTLLRILFRHLLKSYIHGSSPRADDRSANSASEVYGLPIELIIGRQTFAQICVSTRPATKEAIAGLCPSGFVPKQL
ncbi:MAG: hypothetical protein ACRECH_15880, partial [Nitrososphaerales archaeon]